EVSVRAAVAVALRQINSGSFTVDSSTEYVAPHLFATFEPLLQRPSPTNDLYYPHIIWMAMEPRLIEEPSEYLEMFAKYENWVSGYCLQRAMRRICDLTDADARAKHLNAAMEFLGTIAAKTTLADAALDGLIDAFKSKGAPPSIPLEQIFAKLTTNPALADKARRLATLLGDTSASRALIAKINDARASVEDRLKGIQAARETKDEAGKAELLKLLKRPLTPALSPPRGEGGKAGVSPAGERAEVRGPSDQAQQLYVETVRALSAFDGDEIASSVVEAWKKFTLPTRRAAADVLVTRSRWCRALLAGVDKRTVDPQDFSATARRALAKSSDNSVVDHANRVLGRY